MKNNPSGRHIGDRLALNLLLLVVILTGAVFWWTSQSFKSNDPSHDTWVDKAGHLHVLGIILGETTLRQAEIILRSRSDIALYIYPAEHPHAGMTLEAYFPSIADHTKVILLLNADDALLKAIERRSTLPHLYPNKVARMNLSGSDSRLAQSLIVRELTLIPSATITEEDIIAHFGDHFQRSVIDKDSIELSYAQLGLVARLPDKGVTQLHFVNPDLLH